MLFERLGDGSVRLVRRPAAGIWGGLWSPPEFDSREAAENALPAAAAAQQGAPLLHGFTHFDLLIHPLWLPAAAPVAVAEEGGSLWYNAARPALVGLPRPVLQLLENPPP
jgi:A/G-specific adenine glycosylase